jgi:hypothetical protein
MEEGGIRRHSDWFRRFTESLLGYLYIRAIGSMGVSMDKDPKASLGYPVLLNANFLYGSAVEMLMKMMLLTKGVEESKVFQLSHNLRKIAKEVDSKYRTSFDTRFADLLDTYTEVLKWAGRYPVDKSGKPKWEEFKKVALEGSTKSFCEELLRQFELSLSDSEKRQLESLKEELLGPIHVMYKKDFYGGLIMKHFDRIIELGEDYKAIREAWRKRHGG